MKILVLSWKEIVMRQTWCRRGGCCWPCWPQERGGGVMLGEYFRRNFGIRDFLASEGVSWLKPDWRRSCRRTSSSPAWTSPTWSWTWTRVGLVLALDALKWRWCQEVDDGDDDGDDNNKRHQSAKQVSRLGLDNFPAISLSSRLPSSSSSMLSSSSSSSC